MSKVPVPSHVPNSPCSTPSHSKESTSQTSTVFAFHSCLPSALLLWISLLHPTVIRHVLLPFKLFHFPSSILNVIRGRVCSSKTSRDHQDENNHLPILTIFHFVFLTFCQSSFWRTLCTSSTSSTSCNLFPACASFGILPFASPPLPLFLFFSPSFRHLSHSRSSSTSLFPSVRLLTLQRVPHHLSFVPPFKVLGSFSGPFLG